MARARHSPDAVGCAVGVDYGRSLPHRLVHGRILYGALSRSASPTATVGLAPVVRRGSDQHLLGNRAQGLVSESPFRLAVSMHHRSLHVGRFLAVAVGMVLGCPALGGQTKSIKS